MTITINTKVYDQDVAASPNQMPYTGPGNTLSVKDRMDLYRTPPKASPTYSGVGRSRIKLTRTLALTGALTSTGDAIGDINLSFPVGASSADVDTFMTDLSAAAAAAWAKLLAKNLDITH
ncbi:coat protein [ssRNA phage Gerhypos.4_5]|uniref:Coat protein n=2 Tax=Norzivirales TaxID=2842247 RepID=A0A8S5L2S9_9VIRU|nr:coat protein [ssRNA phage Gerhypos.4_5]QDH86684.1 MAG: hypothetical protein H4Bulk46294e4103_000002 [Leviviridae sp.]DAD51969.1 TPA_asm: coat protein [ssRNA phage Gerhypos.4_5]